MQATNKDGQAIGRKGAESRARLLAAARLLIQATPADKLTARAISQAADLASQSFYVYFDDIDELLLCLSREVSNDVADIILELDLPWNTRTIYHHAERVVNAFYRHWDRHRAILNLRNFRADSGDAEFTKVRNDAATPIIRKIASRIRAAQGKAAMTERNSLARAAIIFAAVERMASRYPFDATAPAALEDAPVINPGDLKRAEIDVLALLLSPATDGSLP